MALLRSFQTEPFGLRLLIWAAHDLKETTLHNTTPLPSTSTWVEYWCFWSISDSERGDSRYHSNKGRFRGTMTWVTRTNDKETWRLSLTQAEGDRR